MKKITFVALCAVLFVLSSCSTYQYTARQLNIERQNVIMTPTVVDINADYTKRVDVTSGWCATKEDAMNECKYNAILNNHIDVVVDPIFKIEHKVTKRKGFRATLTGFAGFYTNSRTIIEDMQQLKDFSREDIEKYLILHNPEVLQYLNQHGDVITINNNGK